MKNAAASEANDSQSIWLAKLKSVSVTLEETEAEPWGTSFWNEQETLLLFFYLPVVESLEIIACSLRDVHGGLRDEEDVDTSFEWPLDVPPLSQTLTTLCLIRSSMDPLTIHRMLRQTPNVKVFHYDCYLHPGHAPLRLSILRDALQHIRSSLTDLTVRYEHYNNEDMDDIAVETENAVRGSLGPLHGFPVLTALTTSFPVLFGIDTNTPDDRLKLGEYLPQTLERLTITNDLCMYEALGGLFDDLNAMAIFRQYLAGQILNSRRGVSLDLGLHLGPMDDCLSWVQDREPEWKAATPRLKKLIYDVERQLCMGYWLLPEPRKQLLELCKGQGIEGDVVPQYDLAATSEV
ncbi:hypothetical protein G6011_02693 [Alternaria panax]|uniref:Uncharacterized protein n=1 Tax=Alternaria panax TaxID=48097 RepID=A0AAD4FAD1_9PLEO|nr:hypothetical protein G6011_02693 [Alternaria panax]